LLCKNATMAMADLKAELASLDPSDPWHPALDAILRASQVPNGGSTSVLSSLGQLDAALDQCERAAAAAGTPDAASGGAPLASPLAAAPTAAAAAAAAATAAPLPGATAVAAAAAAAAAAAPLEAAFDAAAAAAAVAVGSTEEASAAAPHTRALCSAALAAVAGELHGRLGAAAAPDDGDGATAAAAAAVAAAAAAVAEPPRATLSAAVLAEELGAAFFAPLGTRLRSVTAALVRAPCALLDEALAMCAAMCEAWDDFEATYAAVAGRLPPAAAALGGALSPLLRARFWASLAPAFACVLCDGGLRAAATWRLSLRACLCHGGTTEQAEEGGGGGGGGVAGSSMALAAALRDLAPLLALDLVRIAGCAADDAAAATAGAAAAAAAAEEEE